MVAHPPAQRAPDGRLVRRLRNEDAVRDAILEMIAEGEPITPETLVTRSGVALRTVYRRFNSLPGAIESAIEVRVAQLADQIADAPVPVGSLGDRAAAAVVARLGWLEQVQMPLERYGLHYGDALDDVLVRDLERRFPAELATLSAEGRTGALALLGVTLRLVSLRYLSATFSSDHDEMVLVTSGQIVRVLRGDAHVAARLDTPA